jgi:hypothetical protein
MVYYNKIMRLSNNLLVVIISLTSNNAAFAHLLNLLSVISQFFHYLSSVLFVRQLLNNADTLITDLRRVLG